MLKALKILKESEIFIEQKLSEFTKNVISCEHKRLIDAIAEIEELQKNLQELILYSKVDNERTACEIMDDLQPHLEKIEKFCK